LASLSNSDTLLDNYGFDTCLFNDRKHKSMQEITIPLDDQSAARLQELARQRGETIEQTAQALLRSTLPTSSPPTPFAPDDPDGSKAILALSGTAKYPGIVGKVNTTNEEIDRLIAEEAMNPHEDE
jgi:hypothetical protein